MKPKNRIRIILAEKEMSNRELSELIDVSMTSVARWVSNRQQPSLKHIYQMAELLEVNLCDFLVKPEREREKDK